MTKNLHLIWALVVAAALLPSDYAHSEVGSLARSAGPRGIPSKTEVKVNAAKGNGRPAHTLALRGGKGYGEGKGTGPAVGLAGTPGVVLKRKASQKLAPKGDKKLLKQTWGVSDSHSPSGLSPRNWGGGSLEIECGDAEVSSISGSTSDCQSLGSGGLSKLKVESDEDAETAPKQQQRPMPRFQGGDMLDQNTKVIGTLGSGAFGTVYSSLQVAENMCLAVKVQRAGSKYTQVSLDEIHLLEEVGRAREKAIERYGHACGGDCVVELKGKFELGRPAKQMCMSFEMLGPSLLDLIIDHGYKGLPLPIARQIAKHCLSGLNFLHACGIVHTDVKPENVLLTLPEGGEQPVPGDGTPVWWAKNSHRLEGAWKLRTGWSDDLNESNIGAKLVDLGNSCFDNHHFSDNIQTIEYRSPEVVIGAGYSTSADIWSTACTIFELVTGEYLFDPHQGGGYSREEDLLAHHQELLGKFSKEFALSGKHSPKQFDEAGDMRNVPNLRFWNLVDVLVDKYGWESTVANEFADFLLPMLCPDPKQRATAEERLAHPWLAQASGGAVHGMVAPAQRCATAS